GRPSRGRRERLDRHRDPLARPDCGRRPAHPDQAKGPVAPALHHRHDDARGRGALARSRARHLPGRSAVGRRRGRDQPLPRPRPRRDHEPHERPARALGSHPRPGGPGLRGHARGRVVRPARDRGQPARRGPVARRARGLRGRVHGVAQAPHAPEHRHRRSRRRGASAGGVGRGHRLGRGRGDLPLRGRLLLDAAALLGAVAAHEGRVRPRRGSHAAGGPRRVRDPLADPALHPRARGLDGGSAAVRTGAGPGDGVRERRGGARRRLCGPGRAAAPARRPGIGAADLPVLAGLPGAAVRGAGGRRAVL
ncbi:MAG: Heme O synthase, protoheme IX farnesyltransferase COX10-CtaB, partial [uncultured Solirubrobacterales bacterium]